MTKSFKKYKKYLLVHIVFILPIFRHNKNFLRILSIKGFLLILTKYNYTKLQRQSEERIPNNTGFRRTHARSDGQISWIYRILPTKAGGPITMKRLEKANLKNLIW